eukprot:COSAG02_NODE_68423_length_245_cov_103.863014_1_plen_31_part_10
MPRARVWGRGVPGSSSWFGPLLSHSAIEPFF